jgi:hypothetical protein
LLERGRGLAQWKMCCDECDGHFSTSQTHCEIFDAAALGKKFRLSWKLETYFVHPGFVNRAGDDCIELTAPGQGDRFFQRRCGSARSFTRWLSWLAIGIFADDFVFGRFRNSVRPQREIDNLRPDPGAIAQRDPDAWFPARVHARNRLYLIDEEHNYHASPKLRLGTQAAQSANMGLIFPAV